MKLQMLTRTAEKKSELKRFRREGLIPAVIYVQEKSGETVTINDSELMAMLRSIQPGRLSTTIFTLVDNQGKERRVIIKDIQYHPTSYKVLHLDFEELHDNIKVNIKVPIECVGTADCPGVKLGGVIRQVIRSLPIRCLPRDIPAVFELDVRALGPRESKRLSDLTIPNTVRPLANLKEVAVVVVKR